MGREKSRVRGDVRGFLVTVQQYCVRLIKLPAYMPVSRAPARTFKDTFRNAEPLSYHKIYNSHRKYH